MKPTRFAAFDGRRRRLASMLLQVQAGDDLGALAEAEELGPLLGARRWPR